MANETLIDDVMAQLGRQLDKLLPKGLSPSVLQADVERALRTALERSLAKMNLVTREELDVQTAVLARTREKLEALEKTVAALEAKLKNSD